MQSQRSCITDFGNGVKIIMNENTYIKLEINTTEKLEERINNLLRLISSPDTSFN